MNVALIGGTPTVRALTTSDDGKTVFVGGNFSSINGVGAARIAAIDVATCSVKALRASTRSRRTSTAGRPREHPLLRR